MLGCRSQRLNFQQVQNQIGLALIKLYAKDFRHGQNEQAVAEICLFVRTRSTRHANHFQETPT